MVKFIIDEEEKKRISRAVLSSLPEWFGIPESTEEYITASAGLPFWTVYVNGEPAGFLALKETGPAAAEIFVMAVRKEYHRLGLGRALWLECLKYAQEQGYQYMQVKTVKRGCYEIYDRANDFYRALGFQELECIPELWDSWNPCQIYVRYIGNNNSTD